MLRRTSNFSQLVPLSAGVISIDWPGSIIAKIATNNPVSTSPRPV
jgi:hypothetical protein